MPQINEVSWLSFFITFVFIFSAILICLYFNLKILTTNNYPIKLFNFEYFF